MSKSSKRIWHGTVKRLGTIHTEGGGEGVILSISKVSRWYDLWSKDMCLKLFLLLLAMILNLDFKLILIMDPKMWHEKLATIYEFFWSLVLMLWIWKSKVLELVVCFPIILILEPKTVNKFWTCSPLCLKYVSLLHIFLPNHTPLKYCWSL